jgi:hypothetical protein
LSYPEVRTLYPDDTLVCNEWKQVLDEVQERHGDQATVTVFPCGSLQIPAQSTQ